MFGMVFKAYKFNWNNLILKKNSGTIQDDLCENLNKEYINHQYKNKQKDLM